ncbi:hypothetical protein [Streptomyces sp. NPDC001781]
MTGLGTAAWPPAPDDPVGLTTRSGDARSPRPAQRLGSTEVRRFEAHGAEQGFGVRPGPATGPGRTS